MTGGKETVDNTVATCWDDDMLDLTRIERRPDPERMLTEPAKEIAAEKAYAKLREWCLPFRHSYWVSNGMLLAGQYPGDPEDEVMRQKLQGLLDTGIRCIINLMHPDEKNRNREPFRPYDDIINELAGDEEVECLRLSIGDMLTPDEEMMDNILNVIDSAIFVDTPVYVHCRGGFGRTGTVVGCWLARHGYASGFDTLDLINRLRYGLAGTSPQTDEQEKMVINWERGATGL